MGRGKTLIKQNEVMRATRGLLNAAAAAGVTGDIEIHLGTGVIKFRIREEQGAAVAIAQSDSNEWNSLL